MTKLVVVFRNFNNSRNKTREMFSKQILIYLKFPPPAVNNSSVKPPQWEKVFTFCSKIAFSFAIVFGFLSKQAQNSVL